MSDDTDIYAGQKLGRDVIMNDATDAMQRPNDELDAAQHSERGGAPDGHMPDAQKVGMIGQELEKIRAKHHDWPRQSME
jgi:hypothetical protein